jgi:four helix bundle protein
MFQVNRESEMASFTNFEDIDAWKVGRELTRHIYEMTSRGTFSRDYGLCNQIRRAAVSVMSNIAEGYERSGRGEFVQFLAVAKGSAGEVRSHLYVALDQGYISEVAFKELSGLAARVSRMVSGLMDYLCRSGIKGTKYKQRASSRNIHLET